MAEAESRARSGSGRQFTLLGFEFDPVITLGLRGKRDSDILFTERDLMIRGIDLIRADRGGEATLHSPGQLVVYPVVDLREIGIGVREFVRVLEDSIKKTLKSYGIDSRSDESESGVFTESGKIAFVGLRVRQGIVTHGLSINVGNDLELFRGIRSCGRALRAHDRMLAWRSNLRISEVYERWCDLFLSSLPLTNRAPHDLSSAPNIGL